MLVAYIYFSLSIASNLASREHSLYFHIHGSFRVVQDVKREVSPTNACALKTLRKVFQSNC
jgi:hypothetical protein